MNLPSNFVALGDSVMTVNPTYAQGCTKAFMGVLALHSALSRISGTTPQLPKDFSTRFFKQLHNKTNGFWQSTRLLDYGVPCTEPVPGESLRSGEVVRWYIRRLQILAIEDEQAARVIWNSSMAYDTQIDAFHPWLLAKIMWDAALHP